LHDQVKLLCALQERRIERVGGTEEIIVDVRIIAANNRGVLSEVEGEYFLRGL
jgi:transcriptional regulator with GAF, ATPase, and Fis domain